MALIDGELVSVFGDQPSDHLPVFAEQAKEELSARKEKSAAVEKCLHARNEHLQTSGVKPFGGSVILDEQPTPTRG